MNVRRTKLSTLQVNMGNLCNQNCAHYHVDASPQGTKIMSRQVMDSIIEFLLLNKDLILDITGGVPELNTHFDYFIKRVRPLVKEIIVRSNLTVLFEQGKEYLPDFFRKYKVHLICSLPCYKEDNVDKQRGQGTRSLTNLGILKTSFRFKNGCNNFLITLTHLPRGVDKNQALSCERAFSR